MKNLWLHGIYISIIGVLGFQLWAKTAVAKQAFSQVDSVLATNYQILNSNSDNIIKDIKGWSSTNPEKYDYLIKKVGLVNKSTKSVENVLSEHILKLDEGKIVSVFNIKKALQTFLNNLNTVPDSTLCKEIMNNSEVFKLMNVDTFWTCFKDNQVIFLNILLNQVKLNQMRYLNYINDKVCGKIELRCSLGYRVAIAPKSALLIEGETFEADIYLIDYYKNYGSMLTFTVENENLTKNDGVAHYSKIESGTGLKKIKVKATICNPATGESTTAISEFEYHVLPKCSKNCQ